jgi:hypothetical protein
LRNPKRARGEVESTILTSQKYISELMKYMRVDSYGSCLHNAEWPAGYEGEASSAQWGNDKFLDLLRGYKFYLNFESADWCPPFRHPPPHPSPPPQWQ